MSSASSPSTEVPLTSSFDTLTTDHKSTETSKWNFSTTRLAGLGGRCTLPQMPSWVSSRLLNLTNRVFRLSPRPSCSCPAQSRCYHIIAAQMWIGVVEEQPRRVVNLIQLRKNKRERPRQGIWHQHSFRKSLKLRWCRRQTRNAFIERITGRCRCRLYT